MSEETVINEDAFIEELETKGQQILRVSGEKTKSMFTSPTFVWFVSLHFASLFSMIGFNISREGLNTNGLFGGPAYYTKLFLFYGINGTYKESVFVPFTSGIYPWLLAPWLAVFLGVSLFFIKLGGFAYNGSSAKDPRGSFFFAFFSDNVYAYEIGFGDNDKVNLFYIGIVLLPIIVASVMTVMYQKRTNRKSWMLTRIFIASVLAFIIAHIFALISDPSISYDFEGLKQSLFENRKFNFFVDYDGQYHPTNMAMLFIMMHIFVLFIFGIVNSFESIYASIKFKYSQFQNRREMLRERREAGITSLPWEIDDETQSSQQGDSN